jgi:hypothetical protein
MAQKRLCMRQIKEILRLKYEPGKSQREIKNLCGLEKQRAGIPVPGKICRRELAIAG